MSIPHTYTESIIDMSVNTAIISLVFNFLAKIISHTYLLLFEWEMLYADSSFYC